MRALIRPAPRASGKKFVVELIEEGRRPLHIQFGDASMEDYTQHHNRERRAHYIARHRARASTGPTLGPPASGPASCCGARAPRSARMRVRSRAPSRSKSL